MEYSKRLGKLASCQFQAALSKHELGDFLSAAPVQSGLFGQNVFLTSTKGKFVLRGKPHYPWQFPKERFGAKLLHRYTKAPVPYPYLYDSNIDIFGWEYILMPCMPGISPVNEKISNNERIDIAFALGKNLAEVHQCKLSFSGEYDLSTDTIKPMATSYDDWFFMDIENWLEKLDGHYGIVEDEANWVREFMHKNIHLLSNNIQPCFVMNDYNPGNILVEKNKGEWLVTGLFDLMEYYFGDGDADFVRLMAIYLDNYTNNASSLIKAFIKGYFSKTEKKSNIIEKIRLFFLRDRLIVWEYGTRPDVAWFNKENSFVGYVKRYMDNKDIHEAFM